MSGHVLPFLPRSALRSLTQKGVVSSISPQKCPTNLGKWRKPVITSRIQSRFRKHLNVAIWQAGGADPNGHLVPMMAGGNAQLDYDPAEDQTVLERALESLSPELKPLITDTLTLSHYLQVFNKQQPGSNGPSFASPYNPTKVHTTTGIRPPKLGKNVRTRELRAQAIESKMAKMPERVAEYRKFMDSRKPKKGFEALFKRLTANAASH
jgi:hypothetical protein